MKMASLTPGTCSKWLWLLPSGPDQVHHPAMRGDPPARILAQHYQDGVAAAAFIALPVARHRPGLNRVGGGVAPAVLPHHRTYGSRIRRFLPSRFRVELTSRGLFARWSIDAATALGTSGPCCFVASSLSGQLSRPHGEIATFPLSTDSALHDLVSAATMASADSHHPIPTPRDVSSTRQAGGPPRVMRVTFMLMPVGFTS